MTFPILMVQKNVSLPTPRLVQPRKLQKVFKCSLKFLSALFVTACTRFYESSVIGRDT